MSGRTLPVGTTATSDAVRRAAFVAPLVAVVAIGAVLAPASPDDRSVLMAAALLAVIAGLSATTIGVYGAILVPGLLLLGVEPRVAAPLSLGLQVLVIPLGAGMHATVGHVRRSIAGPLIVGGAAGSVTGALVGSTVPGDVAGRAVAIVIVVVGLIVLANLRSSVVSAGPLPGLAGPGRAQSGAIGVVAGLASGISGAGWGPIGVKLLILAGSEPRIAVGSSLVGRVAMALAAIVTYGLSAIGTGGLHFDPALFVVLLAGSAGAIVPGTLVIARLGRRRATVAIAILSIALALPTVVGWAP